MRTDWTWALSIALLSCPVRYPSSRDKLRTRSLGRAAACSSHTQTEMKRSGYSLEAPKSNSSNVFVPAPNRKLVQLSVCMNLNSVISRRQPQKLGADTVLLLLREEPDAGDVPAATIISAFTIAGRQLVWRPGGPFYLTDCLRLPQFEVRLPSRPPDRFTAAARYH